MKQHIVLALVAIFAFGSLLTVSAAPVNNEVANKTINAQRHRRHRRHTTISWRRRHHHRHKKP